MAETIIYPTYDADYVKSDFLFSSTRESSVSDSFSSTDETLVASISKVPAPSGGGLELFQIYRSYLSFDLTSITENISEIYLDLYVESVIGRGTLIIAYGGKSLKFNNSDYPNYINAQTIEWSSRSELISEEYNEFYLDPNLRPYPSTTLIVGLISQNDFDSISSAGSSIIVSSFEGKNKPYLRVLTSSGYLNTISGVLSSSINTVNGSSIQNISKINVV